MGHEKRLGSWEARRLVSGAAGRKVVISYCSSVIGDWFEGQQLYLI
jgi:hypothetical protein